MKIGVIVFNLGGPESLDDVKPFLRRLFSEPSILPVRAPFLRNALAYSIATLRERQTRGQYRKIGGASPLRRITGEQAQALSDGLRWAGWNVHVFPAMCVWHPFLGEALESVERARLDRLVVLPLFPQYSSTTTGMGFRTLKHLLSERPSLSNLDIRWIDSWQNQPTYIAAFSGLIRNELEKFRRPGNVQIVFSAHGLPEHYLREGDPYLDQTRETVELLADSLGRGNPYRLAFQSKVGAGQWLSPTTNNVIVELGRQGVGEILVVPVSCVSEQIETLYELDVQYRKVAADAGVGTYRRVRALNTDPTLILALRELVEAALNGS